MFVNWQLFLIHEKTFANDDTPSQIKSFLVQLPILPLATPIIPTKVATVKALQSSMHQCSSYSGHTHLQLLYCVILWKHSNIAVEYQLEHLLHLENFEPAPIWFALEHLQKSAGFSAITVLCLSQLDLHLWAGINKTKKWKFSKKIFTNTLRFAKFANIFFRKLFPLYGT